MTDHSHTVCLDELDRKIINNLQGGFPVSDHPFRQVAEDFDISEDELIARIEILIKSGSLSRFGPIYNAEKMGGGLTLAAMSVPDDIFDDFAEIVNSYPEVAHNYKREHELNMWFVIATEKPEQVDRILTSIKMRTRLPVYNMPKQQEFFLGLNIQV